LSLEDALDFEKGGSGNEKVKSNETDVGEDVASEMSEDAPELLSFHDQ
jgi:hypothetical protein